MYLFALSSRLIKECHDVRGGRVRAPLAEAKMGYAKDMAESALPILLFYIYTLTCDTAVMPWGF